MIDSSRFDNASLCSLFPLTILSSHSAPDIRNPASSHE